MYTICIEKLIVIRKYIVRMIIYEPKKNKNTDKIHEMKRSVEVKLVLFV